MSSLCTHQVSNGNMHPKVNITNIDIRLECRWVQKCLLICNYYVGCLWAPLLVLTQSKETVFWSNLVGFYNKSKILTILFIVKYEKITLLRLIFSVVGAHNQQVFCMFKWGKKTEQQRVLALVLSLWSQTLETTWQQKLCADFFYLSDQFLFHLVICFFCAKWTN